MQKFINITPDMKLKDSRAPLVDNDLTVASHYAAGAFPTQNLVVGMECYRTDLKKKYRLTKLNPATWEDVLTPSEITKVKVNNAVHADKASVADSAKACTGNANTATTAARLARDGNVNVPMTFRWAGQPGQPAWAWGSNDGTTHQVYNPSNFNVNHAKAADSATVATRLQNARTINGIPFDGTRNIELPNEGISIDSNITVTGSKEADWSDNVRLAGGSREGYGSVWLSGNTLTRIAGISAGTYTLKNLLQQLVTKSHTHGAKAAAGAVNCNDCNCNCDSDSDGE